MTAPDALVIVTDTVWCTDDPEALPALNPFPFSLYSDSDLEYLGRLFEFARAGHERCGASRSGSSLRSPSARTASGTTSGSARRLHGPPPPPDEFVAKPGRGGRATFPPIQPLARSVAASVGGHPAGRAGDAAPMISRMQPAASRHPPRRACCWPLQDGARRTWSPGGRTATFLDFSVDDRADARSGGLPSTRMHYRAQIARRVEQRIAESLRLGNAGPSTF